MQRPRNIRGAGKAKRNPNGLRPGDVVGTRAEWEAMKASRRNLSPAEAIRECDFLTSQYRTMFGMPEIDLKRIVAALQAKKIPFVLTGAHGIATWTGRPRSTHDVDILVKSGRNYARAVKAIRELYPELEIRTFFGVAAFFVPGERQSVIDVTYPQRLDNAQTLETAISAEVQGMKVRVPRLEEALANKYGATLALNRDAGKRVQDMVDFYQMVKHSLDAGRDPIDMERLAELGELVWPDGGGKEITEFVAKAKAGEVPNPSPRPAPG